MREIDSKQLFSVGFSIVCGVATSAIHFELMIAMLPVRAGLIGHLGAMTRMNLEVGHKIKR
ncbi:MAG: hypothetical protein CMO80_22695 [Verrucomicrobiales bacterium]|nr:hypothetical protein [Verrucomicrobiales bacterium]